MRVEWVEQFSRTQKRDYLDSPAQKSYHFLQCVGLICGVSASDISFRSLLCA